jgi:hypothetical protein
LLIDQLLSSGQKTGFIKPDRKKAATRAGFGTVDEASDGFPSQMPTGNQLLPVAFSLA